MNILLATQNTHKIQEITDILSPLSSINITIPKESLYIEEYDRSYIENAMIKAQTWSVYYPNHYILADDSGLEVLALNNQPGVISAEYAGKNATTQEHINKLLTALNGITDRRATFISYILLLSPKKEIMISRGECLGSIALQQDGAKGFGYDPIFLPMAFDYKKSMAALSPTEKNQISHRKKALEGLRDYLNYQKEGYHG